MHIALIVAISICFGFTIGRWFESPSLMQGLLVSGGSNDSQYTEKKSPLVSRDLVPNPNEAGRREQFVMFPRRSDAVMVGDSITHSGNWEDIFPNVRISNRGISGDRTDDVLRRISAIQSIGAKKVFLMIGTNDFSAHRDVDSVFHNYVEIIERLRSPNTRVFVQSTIECRNCGHKLQSIRELNEKLKHYCLSRNATYIDVNKSLADKEQGLLSRFTNDGVHLNGLGYKAWSKSIAPYLVTE